MSNIQKNQLLFKYLDEAEKLAKEFTGGYSNHFLSAEDFHFLLKKSIAALKSGEESELNKLYIWFAPTCCWDDFVGMDGQDLANKIFELLSVLNKNRKA